LVAVITDTPTGKDYRSPEPTDLQAFAAARLLAARIDRPSESILPEITQRDEDEDAVSNSTGIRVHQYGFTTWGSVFNDRQLVAVHMLTEALREVLKKVPTGDEGYRPAVACYLAMWVDKIIVRMTSFTRWNNGGENFEQPFDMA